VLLALPAAAQSLDAVPAGARAVTVLVCDADCERPWRAAAAHAAALGYPLLDFDRVAASLRDDRLSAFEALMSPVRTGRRETVAAAAAALEDLPYTVTDEDLFVLALAAGATGGVRRGILQSEGDWLDAAVSISRGRAYNLPTLPAEALSRYLDVAARARPTARLRVDADAPAAVAWVDGRRVGPTPVEVEVPAGWHRVTVERPGRRTAAVATLTLEGDTAVSLSVAGDDGGSALERVVSAAMDGAEPPAREVAMLAAWARDEGLEWVRFVRLGSRGRDERIADPDPARQPWFVSDVYLRVAQGRLTADGPGPNAMIAAADPERFRLGAALGYLHLAPRDHVTVELAADYRVAPRWALDARLGLAHSAQPYYLYRDWVDTQVYPLSVAVRYGGSSGPYAAFAGLAVVPFALGGELRAGWEWAPSYSWRVGVEARGGVTDGGWLAGGGVTVAKRR
jgi:hypothetical protein